MEPQAWWVEVSDAGFLGPWEADRWLEAHPWAPALVGGLSTVS